MSAETIEWLNNNTLIGFTDNRGRAWHDAASYRIGEDNHYAGAIPVGDVNRRLFSWSPLRCEAVAHVPADAESATTLDAYGEPAIAIPMPDRVVIVRSDNHAVLGVFKSSYVEHGYTEWLVGNVSNILGDTLQISSAGLLRGGAQAWVEVSMPENMHNDKTGFSYRPNILALTSLDGSLATTYGRTVTATVCDNTMGIARSEMGKQVYKRRHTAHSATDIDAARDALSILSETDNAFANQIETLAETTVTDSQWFKFLDVILALPESDKGKTRVSNKRDALTAVYRNDKRVSDWNGTALGVVQAVNTFAHHFAEVRGGSGDKSAVRAVRNMEAAVKGENDTRDTATIDALNKVFKGTRTKQLSFA